MNRRVTVIAIVVAIAASFTALHQWQARKAAEAALRSALEQRSQDVRVESEPVITDVSRARLNGQQNADPQKDDEVSVIARYQQSLARQRHKEAIMGASAQNELMSSRVMQEEVARNFLESLPLRYGAFYSAVGMNEDQIRTFEKAMLEKFWTMSDVGIASRAVGAADNETIELRRRLLLEADAKMKATLGDGLYSAFLRYEVTADSRKFVEALAGKLAHAESRLSPEQGRQLTGLIATNTSTASREHDWLRRQALVVGESVAWHEVNWPVVLQEAATILSDAQVDILRRMSVSEAFRLEVENRLKEADKKGRDAARERK